MTEEKESGIMNETGPVPPQASPCDSFQEKCAVDTCFRNGKVLTFENLGKQLQVSFQNTKQSTGKEMLDVRLYQLSRDYYESFNRSRLEFATFVVMHPLISVHTDECADLAQQITENEITKALEKNIFSVMYYQWFVKLIEFLDLFLVVWELATPEQFFYRINAPENLLYRSSEQLQSKCLLLDVLFYALSKEPRAISWSKGLAQVGKSLETTLRLVSSHLISLNRAASFRTVPSIVNYTYNLNPKVRTCQVAPHHRRTPHSVKTRKALAREHKFHVIYQPSMWKCKCYYSIMDTWNATLFIKMKQFLLHYIEFEELLLKVNTEAKGEDLESGRRLVPK